MIINDHTCYADPLRGKKAGETIINNKMIASKFIISTWPIKQITFSIINKFEAEGHQSTTSCTSRESGPRLKSYYFLLHQRFTACYYTNSVENEMRPAPRWSRQFLLVKFKLIRVYCSEERIFIFYSGNKSEVHFKIKSITSDMERGMLYLDCQKSFF